MKLWTVQHIGAWEAARNRGYLTGSEEHAYQFDEDDGRMWSRAYEWLREQMRLRLPGYSGELPIWAFDEKPDLRCQWRHDREHVLLKIDVPRQRLVLTDYDKWHGVLNGWYLEAAHELSETGEDDRPERTPDEIRASWVEVFNIGRETALERHWWGDRSTVQACVDRVYLDEVKKVRSLVRPPLKKAA